MTRIIYFLLFLCLELTMSVRQNHGSFNRPRMPNVMPEEGDKHVRTWMGFPSSELIWGSDLKGVQRNIALIAKTIAKYEPVNILVSSEELREIFLELIDEVPFRGEFRITPIIHPINDLWLRDTGPVFVSGGAAVDFNFNGWGEKQEYQLDAKVAKFISDYSCKKPITTNLVLEGGGIEVDGKGTAIITESCSLNDNRNKGVSKAEMETELDRLLGIKKVIWLPGLKGFDITDGHTDFYARFVGSHKPGAVILHVDESDPDTEINFNILKDSTDSENNPISVIELKSPDLNKIRKKLLERKDAALGYVNFYVCNGAVILPEFGDKEADDNAKNILATYYPDRVIEQINIDYIALGGGGIHCATKEQPRFNRCKH